MIELTKKQIDRQDYVDNAIYHLVCDLNPSSRNIDWNIEMIGDIRDMVEVWLARELELCSDMEFYPYLQNE